MDQLLSRATEMSAPRMQLLGRCLANTGVQVIVERITFAAVSISAMPSLSGIHKCTMCLYRCCSVLGISPASPPLCFASSFVSSYSTLLLFFILFLLLVLLFLLDSAHMFLFPSLPLIILVQMLPFPPSPSILHSTCLYNSP